MSERRELIEAPALTLAAPYARVAHQGDGLGERDSGNG
jgi:hypothetical protein